MDWLKVQETMDFSVKAMGFPVVVRLTQIIDSVEYDDAPWSPAKWHSKHPRNLGMPHSNSPKIGGVMGFPLLQNTTNTAWQSYGGAKLLYPAIKHGNGNPMKSPT
jgi:hypothetical protein